MSGNAFDGASVSGAGATITYDNTHSAHGGLASKRVYAAGVACSSETDWSTSMGAQSQVWFRFYTYVTAYPTAATRIYQNHGTGLTYLTLTTAGKLYQVADTTAPSVITTASVPLSAWFRVEGFVISSATAGQHEIKLFTSPDSVTAARART